MAVSIKQIFIPLSMCMLLFSGCSNDKLSQDTKEAAGQVKEKTKELSNTIKKETPRIVQNMKESYQDGKKKLDENILQKGDKAIIKKDSYMALSPKAYDELYQLIRVNNLNGVEKIQQDNQVSTIKKDSEVEIIERDLIRTKVKIKDSGKEGYLPTSLLEKIN